MGKNIDVANRKWCIKTFSSKEYNSEHDSFYEIIFLIIGLILTYIWVIFLVSKNRRTLELEDKVKKQTKQIQESLDIISKYVIYTRIDLNGTISYASSAFMKISGYKEKEILGKTQNIIKDSEAQKEIFLEFWKTIKAGNVWSGEIKIVDKKGKIHWIEATVTPEFDENNKIISYVFIGHDITAKKDLDFQKEKLFQQSKMASMGEMIANIVHQWRQPLSAITVTASSLKLSDELKIIGENEIEEKMNSILDKANYLSHTIDTFRNFLNENNNEDCEFYIENAIYRAIQIVDASIKNAHIELKNSINKDIKTKIFGKETELSQVIINILNNAKDVIKEKNIQKPWIEIGFKEKRNSCVISIEDNAGGIPDEILPKIFDPYFTTKHKSLGTGLGLHMSYRIIVESFSGKIFARNTKNGAKFYIEINK